MRRLVRLLLRGLFGLRAVGAEGLATPGPVLLLPNHVGWLDWLFLGVFLEEDWRFVTSRLTAQTSRLHRWIMVNRRTFPIDPTSPYAVKHMAEYLRQGGRLVLYPEGRLTVTGALMKLFDGTGFLIHKTGARVIVCYLRGADRQRFTRRPGWKQMFPRITVHFSPVLSAPACADVTTTQARARVTSWVRDQLVHLQFQTEMERGPTNLLRAIIGTARHQPGKYILEDATRQELTYHRLLLGADLLARQWPARLSAETPRVGVLLPNVNAMPVVLLSLWAAGEVPAILNYSVGPGALRACLKLAGLKQVITSPVFLERLKLDPQWFADAGLEVLDLAALRQTVTPGAKLAAWLRARVAFSARFQRLPGWETRPDQTAVVLFTSGSEGMPKGVELTQGNLLANLRQMLAVIDLVDDDRLFNALPLFHSFGLTIGTLLPLVRGCYTFLYPSPLHYRIVPNLVYDRNCTVLLSTNTFLNGYARKAHPFDFRSLRYLFAGAEKIRESTQETWARKFGVRILEGYGATECSPCLSANVPLDHRHGTAGRFLPGLDYRLEPVEGVDDGGRLWVRGPNVMRGYLDPQDNQRFQAQAGWYDTGDIARVDADGFVTILGRLKRFAKISGEMVSLTAIEDALAGAFPQYGLKCEVAIASRPEADKGEMLLAVTNEPRLKLEDLRAVLKARGFSNLFMPRELHIVREIPKLGTGKVNHRELQARLAGPGP